MRKYIDMLSKLFTKTRKIEVIHTIIPIELEDLSATIDTTNKRVDKLEQMLKEDSFQTLLVKRKA